MATDLIWCPACEKYHGTQELTGLEAEDENAEEVWRRFEQSTRGGVTAEPEGGLVPVSIRREWPETDGTPPLVDITINTRKPDKWLFVDLETKEIWRWVDGRFKLKRGGVFEDDGAPG